MNFIWFLFAMPILSLLYSAYLIARGDKPRLPDCVVPIPTPSPQTTKASSLPEGKREVNWISTKEFEDMVHKSDDVIFIDLRSPNEGKTLPPSARHALSITPSHLLEALQWLPPDTSVVLYGAPDLCTSMIWTVRSISSFAPLYVLTTDPVHSEVA